MINILHSLMDLVEIIIVINRDSFKSIIVIDKDHNYFNINYINC